MTAPDSTGEAPLAPPERRARSAGAPSKNQPQESAARSRASPIRNPVSPRLRPSPPLKALSPRSSREASPSRSKHASPSGVGRVRKNSTDRSPHRSSNTSTTPAGPEIPSAASVQRAASATGTPRLMPESAASADGQRPPRVPRSGSAKDSSQNTPNTSRVKSPPRSTPSARASSAPRRIEQTSESKEAESTTKPSEGTEGKDGDHKSEGGVRSPTRMSFGAGKPLESVEESALPETPAIGVTSPPAGSTPRTQQPDPLSIDPSQSTPKASSQSQSQSQSQSLSLSQSQANESESESSSSRLLSPVDAQDGNSKPPLDQSLSRSTTLQPKKSLSQMSTSSSKGKGGDGSVRNMTVETVVNQMPALAVSGGTADRSGAKSDTGGPLRVKHSNETIRPKKEKKKTMRKPTSTTGAASSKADIFEAKIASAVDEADSSDSGETFVYESNPPEPLPRSGSRFHHSRTPSAQSMASQVDHHGRIRTDGHNSVVGKRSMKFTNSLHNVNDYSADGEASAGQASASSGQHRNHIGRHGRPGGHQSILGDAPFVATPTRMRNSTQQRQGSRSNTPRDGQFLQRKGYNGSAFELDGDAEAADDERTPLINPISRSSHHRQSRRPGMRSSTASLVRPSSTRGVCGWVLLGSLIAVLVGAVITALVLCSKPLHRVRIGEISNVIASEEEVVLDFRMFVTNPNLVSIQVDQVDIKIFAKSKYVGSTARSSDGAYHANNHTVHSRDGIDEGTDPIDDPGGADTMLLGHAYRLDSPLTFAPSPFSHARVSDKGEISLEKPANRTADDGTERWKTVVQHPFELIVVGQLLYQLPISAKLHSVSVGRGSVNVTPGGVAPEPEDPPEKPEKPKKPGNGSNDSIPLMPGPVKSKTTTLPVRLPVEFAA